MECIENIFLDSSWRVHLNYKTILGYFFFPQQNLHLYSMTTRPSTPIFLNCPIFHLTNPNTSFRTLTVAPLNHNFLQLLLPPAPCSADDVSLFPANLPLPSVFKPLTHIPTLPSQPPLPQHNPLSSSHSKWWFHPTAPSIVPTLQTKFKNSTFKLHLLGL